MSCGTGFKLRSVKCASQDMAQLDDNLCDKGEKPSAIEACYLTKCTTIPQHSTLDITTKSTTSKMSTKAFKNPNDKMEASTVSSKDGHNKITSVSPKSSKRPTTGSTFDRPFTVQESIESTTAPAMFASWRTGSWTEVFLTQYICKIRIFF